MPRSSASITTRIIPRSAPRRSSAIWPAPMLELALSASDPGDRFHDLRLELHSIQRYFGQEYGWPRIPDNLVDRRPVSRSSPQPTPNSPRSSFGNSLMSDSAQQRTAHCDINHGIGHAGSLSMVAYHATPAHHPAQDARHHPATRQHDQASLRFMAARRLDDELRCCPSTPCGRMFHPQTNALPGQRVFTASRSACAPCCLQCRSERA